MKKTLSHTGYIVFSNVAIRFFYKVVIRILTSAESAGGDPFYFSRRQGSHVIFDFVRFCSRFSDSGAGFPRTAFPYEKQTEILLFSCVPY